MGILVRKCWGRVVILLGARPRADVSDGSVLLLSMWDPGEVTWFSEPPFFVDAEWGELPLSACLLSRHPSIYLSIHLSI